MILNRDQQQILHTSSKHILVLAGAGTGKTTLLIAKIKQLLENGIPPEEILLLTFSRRAADEMIERLDQESTLPYSGTFHATFMKLILEDLAGYGFDQQPLLITEPEQKRCYRAILKDLNLPVKLHRPFLKQLKRVKGNGLTPDMLQVNRSNRYEVTFQQSYQHYQMLLSMQQMIDFDDLLLLPLKRMTQQPDYLKDRFAHILVDEYQDINRLQGMLLSALITEKTKLVAVGDDDQAIYSFRGANSDQIHHFQQIYSDPAIFHLPVNYRCSDTILKSALRVVGHNTRRYPKQLKAISGDQTPIYLKEYYNSDHECSELINQIIRLPGIETAAILCRYRYQIDQITTALKQQEIPYQRLDRFQDGEIDMIDLMLMVKFVLHPEQSILREMVQQKLKKLQITLKQLISTTTPKELSTLLQSHLTASLHTFLTGFEDFHHLLNNYDRYTPPDQHNLKIGTIHSAKGLAFDHLFLPFLAEHLFPGDQTDIEEERRLFYVALTRARKQIFLSYPRISRRFGQTIYHGPSQFLKELPAIYLNTQ